MGTPLLSLPPHQIKPLLDAYENAVAKRRMQSYVVALILLVLTLLAAHIGEVDVPRLISNISNFTNYFYNIIPVLRLESLWSDFAEWMWGFNKWIKLILDTLLIAYVGTTLGVTFGFVLSFLASSNLIKNPIVRFVTRRFLEFSRTVPELVFALIFVIAFGLGPVPGILAIAIHSMGALGKLFSEAVENIDIKPLESVRSSGASWSQTVRFAVLPQVLPAFASYGLLRFEINVRGAAVMGFVGAGGIGQDLLEAIRKFYYSDVSAMLVLIMATVFVIDIGTSQIRHRLIAGEIR